MLSYNLTYINVGFDPKCAFCYLGGSRDAISIDSSAPCKPGFGKGRLQVLQKMPGLNLGIGVTGMSSSDTIEACRDFHQSTTVSYRKGSLPDGGLTGDHLFRYRLPNN